MDRFSQQIDFSPDTLVWVAPGLLEGVSEQILILESSGGKPLTLVSNYPYELWLDGRFVGDGGHRCASGEALADVWDAATNAEVVRMRLHWLNPKQTDVLYRCLFEDAFFAELPANSSWSCSFDRSVRFAAKASAQLPRQNIIVPAPTALPQVPLQAISPRLPWKILRSPIEKARYVAVAPKLIASRQLDKQDNGIFVPETAENVALYVRDCRPCVLQCDTYDLGQIALHRFEIDTDSSPCVLYYSEVADFENVADTRFRAKVQLADAVGAGLQTAVPFGTRGCQYVHVFYLPDEKPSPRIRVWRREYPFEWKSIAIAPEYKSIIDACKINLVACIDGGAVDTCWRERAQWTGDLRMSALALRSLTDNIEVVDLALHQIAQSYDPETGLVDGVSPVLRPKEGFKIPPFHLAFCLTALERDPTLQCDSLVRQVVCDSLETWQRLYWRDGLVEGMPGWYFTDWDTTDLAAAGRDKPYPGAHAVCNAWWNEWCEKMAPECCIRPEVFDDAFWIGSAYALTAEKLRDSPHATAAALNSSVSRDRVCESLFYLEAEIASGRLVRRVTPYFAYFVAIALRRVSQARMLTFVREFYEPIARTYGSIYEKTSGDASLAHGWSVGIADLLVRQSD